MFRIPIWEIMKYEAIIYQKHGAVARVITNRPRYKNAQSRLMIEEMDHASAAANADAEEVRVIILAAAGDTFSSGHDIGTREEKEDMRRRPFPKGVRGEYALSRHLFLDTTLRWRDLDKPTIAEVQGMCIFGGWMFASAMDLIVASNDAKFLPALMQYFSIPWDIPIRKANEANVSQPLHRRRRGQGNSDSSTSWSHGRRARSRNAGDGGRNRAERSIHAEDAQMGRKFDARRNGFHQFDSQRPFALHASRPGQLHEG